MNASYTFALRFCDAMRETKEMFAVRLLPLAKKLVKTEAKFAGCSEAEIVERWAFQLARCPDSRRLLLAHAHGDALGNALADVIREDSPPYTTGKRKAG
jgi:hypothetical protein